MGDFSYKGTDFTILDTAGIRRKKKVEEDVEYYSVNRAIKTIDEADVVLLIIDINTGLVEQDKKIAQQIVRRGKGVILVLNKVDTLSGVPNEIEAIKDRARFLFPILSYAPIVPISAREGDRYPSHARYDLEGLPAAEQAYRHLSGECRTSGLDCRLSASTGEEGLLQGPVRHAGECGSCQVPLLREQEEGLS